MWSVTKCSVAVIGSGMDTSQQGNISKEIVVKPLYENAFLS